MNSEERSNEEICASRRRWSRDGGMGNERSAEDYTDAGCRVLAEHAFGDVASLLARIAAVEAAAQRIAAWVEFHTANHGGKPTERTGISYETRPLLLSDLAAVAVLAASPTPTTEEQA